MSLPISKITARNFKKQTFGFEFRAPVTVFTGENSTGKTARIEAATLALLGYVPDDRPKPLRAARGIWETYASGDLMRVAVEGVASVSRRYELIDGSVEYEGPDDSSIPSVVLDAGSYLSKTGPERTRHLFREFTGNINPDEFLAEIASDLKGAVTAEHGPKVEALARSVAGDLAEPAPDQDFQEWIQELLSEAKEELKKANANLKRMTEAVRADTQIAEVEAPPQNAEELVEQARNAFNAASATVSSLEQQIERVRAEYRTAKAAADKLAGIQIPDIPSLEAAQEDVPIPSYDRIKALAKSRDEQNQVLSGLTSELRVAADTLKRLESAKKCPTCGQDIAELNAAKLKQAKKKVADLETTIASTEKLVAKASELVSAAEEEYNRHNARYEQARKLAAALSSARNQKLAVAELEAVAGRLPQINSDGQGLNVKLGGANSALTAANSTLVSAEASFKRLLAFRATAASRAKLEDELESAQHGAIVRRLLVKVLQTKLEEAVEKAIRPLISTMNELCAPILPAPVTFTDGEILLDGHTHRSSSDSEKLLIYAALCVALAAKAPLKVVIIGRLESFDWKKRPALVALLMQLIQAGKIDQAILVGVQTSATQDRYDFPDDLVDVVVPGRE